MYPFFSHWLRQQLKNEILRLFMYLFYLLIIFLMFNWFLIWLKFWKAEQGQIQDNPPDGGADVQICQIISKRNCMKVKKFGMQGGRVPGVAPWIHQYRVLVLSNCVNCIDIHRVQCILYRFVMTASTFNCYVCQRILLADIQIHAVFSIIIIYKQLR